MRKSRLLKAIVLTTAIGILAGCGGKIRYPSYYLLNVPAPPSARNSSKPILGPVSVREFSAPSYLRSGPIVYRPSQQELNFYQFHHWAEDPRRVVTAAMVEGIQARAIFQSVDMFNGRGSPEYLITGTLDHLDELEDGMNVSIEVSLSARLINLQTGDVLWHDRASKTTKLDQRSVPGIVAEMSRDLTDAVDGLVSSMQDRITAASASASNPNNKE
jgi:cholesterol transport system auxiliary component